MKVRQGFVSNSSTSSFCIYGASIDEPASTWGFPLYHGDGDYYHYQGIEWCEIQDDETGGEFKERVVAAVNGARLEHGLKPLDASKFGTCSHAWYDG